MARLAAFALALALAGCASPVRDSSAYEASPDRPDAIPDRERGELARARAALNSGDWSVARAILDTLSAARPGDVSIALLAQEAAFFPANEEQRQRLIEAARTRASSEPSEVALLLAARIEPDPARALDFARRAIDAAPQSAWPRYALAFLLAGSGDWIGCQTANAKALELDPGHRSAARLEAAILARSGRGNEAISALETWLEATAGDPRIAPDARADARLDLAQLLVQARRDEDARDVLAAVPDDASHGLRRACLEAAVEQGLGDPLAALEAARAAQARDPGELTPLVQEALLYQHHLKDPDGARRAWTRVLESVKDEEGLAALVEAVRARVALERNAAGAP